jgi:hypothetical protein
MCALLSLGTRFGNRMRELRESRINSQENKDYINSLTDLIIFLDSIVFPSQFCLGFRLQFPQQLLQLSGFSVIDLTAEMTDHFGILAFFDHVLQFSLSQNL